MYDICLHMTITDTVCTATPTRQWIACPVEVTGDSIPEVVDESPWLLKQLQHVQLFQHFFKLWH